MQHCNLLLHLLALAFQVATHIFELGFLLLAERQLLFELPYRLVLNALFLIENSEVQIKTFKLLLAFKALLLVMDSFPDG